MPVELAPVMASWTQFVVDALHAIHHWDLVAGPTTYRVFLLPSGLQVDLAFSPAAEFILYAPTFHSVFGPYIAGESPEPTADAETVGLGWLYVLHARACIERAQPWRAEWFISSARDSTITLACMRLGLPSAYGRGADRLPDDVKASLEPAVVRSLETTELRHALRAAASALLAEVQHVDAQLAERLASPLREFAG